MTLTGHLTPNAILLATVLVVAWALIAFGVRALVRRLDRIGNLLERRRHSLPSSQDWQA